MTAELTGASLQERFAPKNACFGCGPANAKGLRIRSFPAADGSVVCEWMPERHHEAFAGVLSGGAIGTLLDCHSNWTATWHLKERDGLDAPPSTVTASFAVKFRRPTPTTSGPVRLVARAVSSDGPRVEVESALEAGGETCATFRGTFVAVEPGNPAYHRW